MENAKKSGRIVWVDAMRAVMMFFIVLGHSPVGQEHFIKTYVNYFHVAAFVFISGYLFGKKPISAGRFLVSKFKSLMIPYYAFSLISIVIFSVLGRFASSALGVGIESVNIFDNILKMLYASGAKGELKWNLPLWFLPCLFVINVMFFLMSKVLAKISSKKCRMLFLSAVFAVFGAAAFINYYFLKLVGLPFGIEAAIYLMPFFIAGYALKESNIGITSSSPVKRCALGVLLIVISIIPMIFNRSVSFPVYVASDYGKLLLFYISAFLGTAGYTLLCSCFEGKMLEYIGKRTLWILVLHKFPILVIQVVLINIMARSVLYNAVFSIVIAVLSTALCLVVGEVIDRFFPFLFGKWYKLNSPNQI